MANAKRFYLGQPGTTMASIYTVPANTTGIIKEIILTNTTATPADISLSIVPSGGSAGLNNRIFEQKEIPANGSEIIQLTTVVEAGDTIQMSQITDGAITATMSGVIL